MLFEEIQDGHHGSHLGYWNQTNLAILHLYVTQMPPIKFQLSLTYGVLEMSFEEFQYGSCGGHLGYQNGMNLAILNLYATVMPPIKFRLNRTYRLGGDVL